jgi:hypothetical protein
MTARECAARASRDVSTWPDVDLRRRRRAREPRRRREAPAALSLPPGGRAPGERGVRRAADGLARGLEDCRSPSAAAGGPGRERSRRLRQGRHGCHPTRTRRGGRVKTEQAVQLSYVQATAAPVLLLSSDAPAAPAQRARQRAPRRSAGGRRAMRPQKEAARQSLRRDAPSPPPPPAPEALNLFGGGALLLLVRPRGGIAASRRGGRQHPCVSRAFC